MNLPDYIQKRINLWLEGPYNVTSKEQIYKWIEEEESELLIDSFYQNLEFGTGGLRGELGPGTNRMNFDTVGMATQGFAEYLNSQFAIKSPKVVISYDSRHGSSEFASHIAKVFIANGLEVFLFSEMRPTPLLSFAIRYLGAQGGVMVTASHNPKEYNGYKAYWTDGGQLISPHDEGVMRKVSEITDPSQVQISSTLDAVTMLGKEIDEQYFKAMLGLSLQENNGKVDRQSALKIIYSPLHGTGITLVPILLQRWGFDQVHLVEEQSEPNGDFPTVSYPNPEEPEAMSMGINLAKKLDADLVLATDPDADRVGIAIKKHKNDYLLLNGNQIGSLIVHYVLSQKHILNTLKKTDYTVKTIVTTDLIREISSFYQVPCYEVLTGFKYIGELMTEKEGKEQFLVGGEESFGYLIGDFVRDKDAVISCAFLAEMANFYQKQGKSLYQVLSELYDKFGFFQEKLISITKKGESGAQEIKSIMNRLRVSPPQTLGGIKITEIKDFHEGVSFNIQNGQKSKLNFPKSNVIQLISEDGDVISARPSGTEPKIKFYCSVKGAWNGIDNHAKDQQALVEKIDKMMQDLIL